MRLPFLFLCCNISFTIMAEGEYILEDVEVTSVAPELIDETFHSGCIGM